MIFKPGFRISIIDTFVIVIAITASTLLHKTDIVFSVAIIFVVGHFFLFCNVFRLSRKPELNMGSYICIAGFSSSVFRYYSMVCWYC